MFRLADVYLMYAESAIRNGDNGNGVLCIIGNYGGDVMNFEMACEIVAEEGIKTIKEFFGQLIDWKKLDDLIPNNFKKNSKYKKTGKAGIFAGSLELVKEGNLRIKQKKLYDDIYIRENK